MYFPANIYLFKVNNRNTEKRCEIYSKLTIKTPERRQFFSFSIVDFEQVKARWLTTFQVYRNQNTFMIIPPLIIAVFENNLSWFGSEVLRSSVECCLIDSI